MRAFPSQFSVHRPRRSNGRGARGISAAASGTSAPCQAPRRGPTARGTGRRREAKRARRRPPRTAGLPAARGRTVLRTRAGPAGIGRVPAFHWANRLSSAASIGAIRRRNSRPSSSPIHPPDISPARAPFSPVNGLEAGDVSIVRKLVNKQGRVKPLFREDRFFLRPRPQPQPQPRHLPPHRQTASEEQQESSFCEQATANRPRSKEAKKRHPLGADPNTSQRND